MLELDQSALAVAASVSRNVIVDFERGRRTPNINNLAAIQRALEAAGVVFVDENGGGAGVRLKSPSGPLDHARRAQGVVDARVLPDRAIDTHFEGSSETDHVKGRRRRTLTETPEGGGDRSRPKTPDRPRG